MTQTNQKTGKVRTIRRGMGSVEMKGKAFPRAKKLTVKKVPEKKRKLGCINFLLDVDGFCCPFKNQPFSTIWGETDLRENLFQPSNNLKEGRCEEDGHEGEGHEGEGHEEANEKSHEGECNRQGQASKIFCLAREEGKDIHRFEEGHVSLKWFFFGCSRLDDF